MYQVNEWSIWVEKATGGPETHSIMGRLGFAIYFAHIRIFRERGEDAWFDLPKNMVPYLQHVILSVGNVRGIREDDIIPTMRQSISGPERQTFTPLLVKVKEACELLGRCNKLQYLKWTIRSIEEKPASIDMVIDPFRYLRGIKEVNPAILSVQDDQWVDWKVNTHYGLYLSRIMGMSKDSVAPPYLGDAKELELVEDKIFKFIGARWLGGDNYEYDDSDDDDDDEDAYGGGFFNPTPLDMLRGFLDNPFVDLEGYEDYSED